MCGICGFAGLGDEPALGRMNHRLSHRGPDGEGLYADPAAGVYLGHKRLAIIDLESGAQPMRTADGRLCVTFNGEIYNHAELRKELERAGRVFMTSHCDTETLLHGYLEWGDKLPERLSGMWAFAIYDRLEKKLFLSRDPFGKKPLYYYASPQVFAFASQPSSLGEHPEIELEVSRLGLRKYFAHGFFPAETSLYQGVKKLPAGSNLCFNLQSREIRLTRHFDFKIEPCPSLARRPEPELAAELSALIEAAVKRRLMADVGLGVFLSGGIDSTSVTAFASRFSPGLRTFSIGFGEPSFDESAYAQLAAKRFATHHHSRRLGAEEGLKLLDELADRLDEPLADSSIWPTYLLCRETRKHVTVALGGDGADELFAGYDPFRALKAAEFYAKFCPKPVHQALRLLAARLPAGHANMHLSFKIKRFLSGLSYAPSLWNPVWLAPLEPGEISELLGEAINPHELYSEAIACFESCASRSIVDKTLEFYTKFYLADDILVKVDRASMLNSLEVRAPYLDREVADFARRLPHDLKFRQGKGKYILKKALQGLVPEEIIKRPKKGFGAPLGQWFKQGRFKLPENLEALGLNRSFIAERHKEHLAGNADNRLFLFAYWLLAKSGLGTAAP